MNRLRAYTRGFTLVELPAVSRREARGFTLVELLVVILIIAMLVSILVPSMRRARGRARTDNCAGNLHNIHTAWTNYNSQGLSRGVRASHFIWTLQLISQVNFQGESYICPEDGQPALSGLDGLAVRCYKTGPSNVNENTPHFDMDIFKNLDSYGSNATRQEGDFTWRVNEEEYHRLMNYRDEVRQRLASGQNTWDDGTPVNYDLRNQFTQYTPGKDNPGVSYLMYEDLRYDSHRDYDFYDVIVKLDDKGDGKWNVNVAEGAAGYSFKVVGADGSEMDQFIDYGAVDLDAEALPTSYGANNMMAKYLAGESKIILLDYNKAVADVAGPDANAAEFDEYKAPRHLGKSNVLYGDGSVRWQAPSEIDPNDVLGEKLWWNP